MKKNCRICSGTAFKTVINFGKCPLWNSLLRKDEIGTEKIYPLKVVQCQSCFLVQTEKPIDTHTIYTDQDYLYFSSDMPGLKEYFGNYATDIKQRFLKEEDTIIEVYEPYLMQLGFIERTPRGRVATERAYTHLGMSFPNQPSFLS